MNKQALIYEFMSNGSLERYKYKQGRSSLSSLFSILDWKELYHIVSSITQGLDYLHERCNTKILHLDIKPQNVLFDEKFCPKIADFGLAKICKNDKSSRRTFSIRGTPGYIAPEMFSRAYGGISYKSDVYGYGMLILEMMEEKDDPHIRGSHGSESYFPDWLYKDLDEDFIYYRSLAFDKEDEIIIQKILLVGLCCIQIDPLKRPSIKGVVKMLQEDLNLISRPQKSVMSSSPTFPLLSYSSASYSDVYKTNSIIEELNG
ncbi:hypothetical protein Ahy_B08g090764 [Arachis hypogaea]|uniref:Protein kinase domain-containing protein n=1 Tax=Arachis hypogaea TaxID=3818 RepID=A0A444Y0L8_ARAHY|nr:hypothetical protein Ahy_B08g090764 [Arachis hypogaea]